GWAGVADVEFYASQSRPVLQIAAPTVALDALQVKGPSLVFNVTNTGKVGVGTATSSTELDVFGTGGILVPRSTTALRPFGQNGMIRYNTNLAKFEVYENNDWETVTTSGSAIVGDNLGNHNATQAIVAVTGTAATPSYTFAGQNNRSMYAVGT